MSGPISSSFQGQRFAHHSLNRAPLMDLPKRDISIFCLGHLIKYPVVRREWFWVTQLLILLNGEPRNYLDFPQKLMDRIYGDEMRFRVFWKLVDSVAVQPWSFVQSWQKETKSWSVCWTRMIRFEIEAKEIAQHASRAYAKHHKPRKTWNS